MISKRENSTLNKVSSLINSTRISTKHYLERSLSYNVASWKRATNFSWIQDNTAFFFFLKGAVMQLEKVLINDRLRVSKVSWKFRIPTIYNFGVIYSWNLQFS